jgi:sugar O-acyltransferase (sialic acid O-acetyltransferase NeuD family)
MTTDIIFWGATGQAKVLRELIEGTQFRLVALVDRRDIPSPFPEIPLLIGEAGLDNWLQRLAAGQRPAAAVAIGGDRGKDRIGLRLAFEARGMATPTLVHRSAFVARNAAIGAATQILAGAHICAAATIGQSVIVNTAASVDHDCVLEDGVHVGPGAVIAGEARIGERAFIGAGATILPRINIGHDAVVGAGAVVTQDVPAGIVVVGNPARQLQDNHG